MVSQKKKRTRGGAGIFQMCLAPRTGDDPRNIAPYAEAAEYQWSVERVQEKVSGCWERCTSSRRSQMRLISYNSCMDGAAAM
jgi:hypothetical protein